MFSSLSLSLTRMTREGLETKARKVAPRPTFDVFNPPEGMKKLMVAQRKYALYKRRKTYPSRGGLKSEGRKNGGMRPRIA